MRSKANMQKSIATTSPTGVQKLLTVAEVADILGLSKVKIYALLKSGLPSVKIDGARRVQPDKLQTWIEQHSA